MAPKLKCPSESSHLSELRPSVVRCIIEHVGEHYVTLGPYFPCDRRDSGCPWFWRNRRSLHWNREGTVLHCSCDLRHSARAGSYGRSEEHTSELQSLMRISYAVFCLTKKNNHNKFTRKNQSEL